MNDRLLTAYATAWALWLFVRARWRSEEGRTLRRRVHAATDALLVALTLWWVAWWAVYLGWVP